VLVFGSEEGREAGGAVGWLGEERGRGQPWQRGRRMWAYWPWRSTSQRVSWRRLVCTQSRSLFWRFEDWIVVLRPVWGFGFWSILSL
jgi:hypothetical protein